MATLQAFSFPPFRLDLVNQQLWRDEQLIFLKPKALAVLRYLLEHPQRLVTKAELLDNIWGGVHVSEGVLKTQLSDIRLALGDEAGTPQFIETAHGRGYRFIGAIREVAAAAAAGQATPSFATFVGRELELASLDRAFASARGGQRQLMFVASPAGVGKTSLVEAFCERLGRQGGVMLARGQCVDHGGAGEAYLPLLEALGRICRSRHGRALVTVLRRYAPSWLSQLPGLADGCELPVQQTVGLSAAPERMLREMAEALESFALDQPIVLLFEDVHWADASTLTWMAYVARRPDPAQLLVIATYRPLELDALDHPLGAVKRELQLQQRSQEIFLPPFVRDDVEAYLSRRFGAHHLPQALAELLLVHTGGNPLFIAKLLDSWVERRLLEQRDEGWRLASPLASLAACTPASIVSLIQSEIDRLTPTEQVVLEAASVAGLQFAAASVSAALGRDLVAVEDVCVRLARRGRFIRSTGTLEWPDGTVATSCEFIHELYRHTTYQRIGAARRARFHQRIGERLEAAHGVLAKNLAVELARHFQRGGERNKARLHWQAAADQALGRSAYLEAVEHFEQALALLPVVEDERERLRLELELQVAIGGALGMTRGHAAPEVERRYARARQLCVDLDETQRLTQTLASILVFYLVRGDYRTVCSLRLASSSAEGSTHDEANLGASVVVGVAQLFMGELAGARARLERAIPLSESSQSPSADIQMLEAGALARTMAGVTLWLLGYPDQGLRLQLETLALGECLHDPCTIALASATLTLLLQLRGDSSDVLERLDASIAHCEKHGFVYYLANLRMLGSLSAAAEAGDWKERLGSITAGWEAVRATGSDLGDTRLCSLVALAHARSGSHAEAFRLLDRALERVESHAERWWEPELYRMLGELVQQAGVVPEAIASRWHLPRASSQCAEACFVRALEVARGMGARSLELRAALALARCWQNSGRAHDAERQLRRVYSCFTEGFATRDSIEARRLLRELASVSNDEALAR